jgi:ketosteroid isomerase-like protein
MSAVGDLDRLVAVEEIKQLKARYFTALDAQDWDAYVAVFTEDAVMDLAEEMQAHSGEAVDAGTDPVSRGREAIRTFIAAALEGSVSVHEGHMPVIEITGPDTARGTWGLHDWITFADKGTQFHGYGHYHEEYGKVDGEWLISFMSISRIRVDWSDIA